MPLRLKKPLTTLWDFWLLKAIVTTLWVAIEGLLVADVNLVVLVFVLIGIDFVTGIWSSWKRGNSITSIRFRQTGIKVIEYSFILIATGAIANSFDMGFLQEGAYFYVAMTELISILENVLGSRSKAREFLRDIRTIMNWRRLNGTEKDEAEHDKESSREEGRR